jgi:adenine-specific DNA-methyltransferase
MEKQKKKKWGQYFTTNLKLKEVVVKLVKNNPSHLLEPSIGQGDLVLAIQQQFPHTTIDMYEIDSSIPLLHGIDRKRVLFQDFLQTTITTTYKTIVGNPPYVKHKKGNLYIDFTKKCWELLDQEGELIFIVPSDFFKMTRCSSLLINMLQHGHFTDIFHPHEEGLFQDASIDVLIYRYCKSQNNNVEKHLFYNGNTRYLHSHDGVITFEIFPQTKQQNLLQEVFNVYVGIVSGKDSVFKHDVLGNIKVLVSNNRHEKFILLNQFPTGNKDVDEHMLSHKKELLSRRIKKFTENNWFQWGALRNIEIIHQQKGRRCIYVHTLTRNSVVAFQGEVGYFGGSLLMLVPKQDDCDLDKIVLFLNAHLPPRYTFSGRFKIGHKQLCQTPIL